MDLSKKIANPFKQKYIPISDLEYINELLKSGISLKNAFSLIRNASNANFIDPLILKLDKGEMIERVVSVYIPKDIGKYVNNLLKHLSFANSLELALSFYKKNKDNFNKLQKSLSYPLILLFVSLTALFLFDSYGLDSILNLMKTFKSDISSFTYIRILIRIVVYAFYIIFIVVSILLLYFINPKRITVFYILLIKYLPNSIIKTYFTEDFVSLFLVCIKLGYKTKDSLIILKSLTNKPIVSFMAFHLDELLLKGSSLKEASEQKYYDESLAKFINIASYTNNFLGIMNSYVELTRNKLENKIKFYTTVLQASSYAVIGIVIIFIYQVLLLPMQAITNF